MKLHSILLLPAIILISHSTSAQNWNTGIDVNTANGSLKFNDPGSMRSKPADISYDDIAGQYLWKDEWNPAIIIMKVGGATKMSSTRLNLYTNEIYYIGKDGEMAAAIDKVKRIIVLSDNRSDSTKIIGVFDVIADPSTRNNILVQVMNDGNIQLLKRTKVIVNKERLNPTTGKEEFRFTSSSDYLIKNGPTIKPVKALSKSSVFELVPTASTHEEWLASNKNKLKKADDVAEFFTYLNSQDPQKK